MYKVVALIVLCAVAASARIATPSASIVKKAPSSGILGTVNPIFRCGGVGTPLQLRISDCDGYCRLQPGQVYYIEEDFVPSSAAQSLTLRVEICPSPGFCTQILSVIIPNSSVLPGQIYTARYSIVPNDVLSGLTVEFRGRLFHTENLDIVEICVFADIDIL